MNSPRPDSLRGQAMVEFAIVAMVLLLLIFGALQFALIYHAKITLNYAAFETARAGAVNNARMWAMELAFARALAPLYTTPYVTESGGSCSSNFELELSRETTPDFQLDNVRCARQRVRDMLTAGLVRLTLVNPSESSFLDHGYDSAGTVVIPNDNLMYRSAEIKGASAQSVQDANLIKVHVGLCYELIVPLVDRLIARMIATAPNALQPENFGPPRAGSFAEACVAAREADGTPRRGIPIYAQGIMRMQSDPILDSFCAGQCSDGA
ncbi:MAG: TadE family protein [Gammaproteobacteria bacterium]